MKKEFNGLQKAAIVFGLLLSSSAFAQCNGPASLGFQIQNNTFLQIDVIPDNGSPGSCQYFSSSDVPIVCQSSANRCRILQTVNFYIDGNLIAPDLNIGVLSKRPGDVTIQNPQSKRYCLVASVTPTQWDGESDVTGTITFNYDPLCKDADQSSKKF